MSLKAISGQVTSSQWSENDPDLIWFENGNLLDRQLNSFVLEKEPLDFACWSKSPWHFCCKPCCAFPLRRDNAWLWIAMLQSFLALLILATLPQPAGCCVCLLVCYSPSGRREWGCCSSRMAWSQQTAATLGLGGNGSTSFCASWNQGAQ